MISMTNGWRVIAASCAVACCVLVAASQIVAAQAIIKGVVFSDLNGDGVQQPGERGIAGVMVSNQDAVVVTDITGSFELGPGPNGIIFVSEPDGFRAVKSFWQAANTSGKVMEFAMKRSLTQPTFTFVDASDTHLAPASLPQTQRFRAVVDSVRPDFVMIVGDLVKDALRVPETTARQYYDMVAKEFGAIRATVKLVPGNHENFGIETQLSHVDPANPLFGRAMYHHYFGPDYYSFTRGGVHFIGLNSVDISGTSYYGHVDSVQLAWLEHDLAHVPKDMPVVTFNHIPLVSASNGFAGYDDGPPAPSIITVNGKTSFRHLVSNASDVLTILRPHNHVLAIGAHIHAGERITYITDGAQTRFEQSPAIVGPSGIPPFTFPSGVIVYTVHAGKIDAGEFIPVTTAPATGAR